MALFDRFRKKETAKEEKVLETVVGSPTEGTVVPMEEIPDPVFSQGVLGTCCGVVPEQGKVFAPINGEIVQVSDTKHAVGIASANGLELIIHVGIDTVDMEGDGFTVDIKKGDKVKKGDLILTMDLDKIKAAGHPDLVILAVTNPGENKEAKLVANENVRPGEDLFQIA